MRELIIVSPREVSVKTIAIITVIFFMKAIPVGALNNWSDPPPPNNPAMPLPLPAWSKTIRIRLTQAIKWNTSIVVYIARFYQN
jgi:hypothetical protein